MLQDRGNVAGDEEFVFAEADDDGRAEARSDNFLRIARGERHQGVGAAHYRDGFQDGFFQRFAFGIFFDEVRDDFGVRLGDEFVAFGNELALQLEIIFDDAVVDDYDFAGAVAVRMRVFFSGAAVRGPAGVADAVDAIERRDANGFFEILQLAGGAADFEFAVGLHYGDAGGIVAAIFEAFEAVKDYRDDALGADVADNAAHVIYAPRSCLGIQCAGGWAVY